jgi:phosphoribosylformylglycinamidine synthase
MRRTKNPKVVGRASRDHQAGLKRAVLKGKDRLPGQRAGVRKPSRTTPKAPTTKAGITGNSGKPSKSSPSSPKSRIGSSSSGGGAPSWESHVHKRNTKFPLKEFNLAAMSDDELVACSKALGIRLSLSEMKDARKYFESKGRNPTDVEMEALGQAWSEHCCYKSSKPVLKRHVYGIAEDKIICREDAGVLPFDGEWCYVPKLESHNHPSAIEPYGGAATGIGGVIRDVLCMGAQPVALLDPLFFGPLDTKVEDLAPGVKHPSFLLSGVISGIRDYGNRVGIPTVAGGITFHPGYTGNCLVNVGCVGILHTSNLTHSRAGNIGDVFVYLGNPTGRDGIHGVAFASEELSEASEEASRSAVQVGDAILKEPLIHVTLEVIRDGLVTGCKDFGGGGLSCVAGELAYDAGFGCEIQLDKVPTKVPGMAPWEIWVSESQERMMVTARPEQAKRILEIAKKWDVPAAIVGKVIKEPVNRVLYHGTKVLEFDLKFSTGGPVYDRPMAKKTVKRDDWLQFPQAKKLGETLLWMLAHPNVMSKEWVVRQYDHEVRANTVLKPFQGVMGHEGPGDAAVLKPVKDSNKGLALCSGVNPNYTLRDPYWGAASAIDESVRNLAAVGARISSILDNLNFGNPEKPERMWELEQSAKGLGDMCRALDIPFASGNVSLYNEGPTGPIPPTPTVMGCGILSHYKHATTMDLKQVGNAVYIVGRTGRDLGGSLYLESMGKATGERVPQTDAKTLQGLAGALVTAIEKGFVRAAHDCSEGGLAVTLAEMAFAGKLGAAVDVSLLPLADGKESQDLRDDLRLFAESNTRWLAEVPKGRERDFEFVFSQAGFAGVAVKIGSVTGDGRVVATSGKDKLLDVSAEACRKAWSEAMPKLMGVSA